MKIINKIGIWGDSILKGVILDEVSGRYRMLAEGAVSAFGHIFKIDIKNNSRFGCTAPKALENLDRSLGQGFQADVVLLEFGGNDCDYNWEAVSLTPQGDHQPNTKYETFILAMENMVDHLLEKGIRPVLMSLPPIDADRYFKWLTKSAKINPDHILSFIGAKDYIYRQQERYSRAITALAYKKNLILIDVRDRFLQEKDLRLCLCGDGIHPNERGQRLISEVITRAYENYLLPT